jgi:hypothetical protein
MGTFACTYKVHAYVYVTRISDLEYKNFRNTLGIVFCLELAVLNGGDLSEMEECSGPLIFQYNHIYSMPYFFATCYCIYIKISIKKNTTNRTFQNAWDDYNYQDLMTNNYQGISLLKTSYKILTNILSR